MEEIFYFVFLLISIFQIVQSQVGNPCYMRSTRIQGICKISSDCPEVEEEGRNGISPTVCGYFQLTIPIVCCRTSSFSDGDFQSPSSPSRPNYSNNNDDLYSNEKNNPSQIIFNGNAPFNSRPTTESYHNNHYHTTRKRPTHSRPVSNPFLNIDNNDDSIVYPSDQNTSPVNRLRKSDAKCAEYIKAYNNVVQAIPLLTETEVVNLNIVKCDNNKVPLIVGGEPAAPGEFPFMAALGYLVDDFIDWRCGATLISERYVVTAAHCTYSRDAGPPVIVRLGETDLTKPNGGRTHVDYNVAFIETHPKYNYPLKYNDIALIKLSEKVTFTKYIRPACLYTKPYLKESQSIATGFGKDEFAASENLNKLMKVALNIYDNERCSHTFANDKRSLPRGIISSMLCAGELKGGRDTCQGDSGGPLLVTDKTNQCKFYLTGITSFGRACGEANTPAVYTKVSEYLSWIESIVW